MFLLMSLKAENFREHFAEMEAEAAGEKENEFV